MDKKYIFFDIDGTLTDSNPGGDILPSTFETLDKLQKNGHFVAIATGRSYTMAKQAMEQTGIQNVVCNGGNALVIDGKLQYNHPLEREKALKVLHECIDKDIPVMFAISDGSDTYALNDHFLDLLPNREDGFYHLHINPNMDIDEVEEFHKLFIGLDADHEEELESRTELGYARYFPTWMMIEPDDKYKGILDMVHTLHGKEEDIVVFGDGHNDLSMMKQAPTAIAMGNAIDELKEVATFITKDNKSDGIEYACKYFGWID